MATITLTGPGVADAAESSTTALGAGASRNVFIYNDSDSAVTLTLSATNPVHLQSIGRGTNHDTSIDNVDLGRVYVLDKKSNVILAVHNDHTASQNFTFTARPNHKFSHAAGDLVYLATLSQIVLDTLN